jgi:hypothetical protein
MQRMKNQTESEETKTQKECISFFLNVELIDKLNDVRFYIQKQLPREKRKKLTKTKLFELILETAAEDYKTNEKSGILWKTVNKWL